MAQCFGGGDDFDDDVPEGDGTLYYDINETCAILDYERGKDIMGFMHSVVNKNYRDCLLTFKDQKESNTTDTNSSLCRRYRGGIPILKTSSSPINGRDPRLNTSLPIRGPC